jgi:hypothetical protein
VRGMGRRAAPGSARSRGVRARSRARRSGSTDRFRGGHDSASCSARAVDHGIALPRVGRPRRQRRGNRPDLGTVMMSLSRRPDATTKARSEGPRVPFPRWMTRVPHMPRVSASCMDIRDVSGLSSICPGDGSVAPRLHGLTMSGAVHDSRGVWRWGACRCRPRTVRSTACGDAWGRAARVAGVPGRRATRCDQSGRR